MKRLKDKVVLGTSFLDDFLEIINTLIQPHITRNITASDNMDNYFGANDWIIGADKPQPQSHNEWAVLLSSFEGFEEKKNNQFCQRILATKANNLYSYFYKSDEGLLHHDSINT